MATVVLSCVDFFMFDERFKPVIRLMAGAGLALFFGGIGLVIAERLWELTIHLLKLK